MPLLIVLIGVLLLIFMIVKLKLNTFVIYHRPTPGLTVSQNPNNNRNRDRRPAWSLGYHFWFWFHAWPTGVRCRWWLPHCNHVD